MFCFIQVEIYMSTVMLPEILFILNGTEPLPVRMYDDYGNDVRLSYNNGMLETVTDPAGRVTRYEYLDTHLYKIIRPDGTFTQYNFIWVLL